MNPRGLQPHARLLTRLCRRLLRVLVYFRVFYVEVVNRNNVPDTGPAIVACNHISIADPVFLWGALRRPAVAIAMSTLWWIPVVGQIMWLLGHIPIRRGKSSSHKKALRAATRVLGRNGLVFMYPEGKCSPEGTLLPFKQGVARLAFNTCAPVIPVGIRGSNQVKSLTSWRVQRKAPVRLVFGEPLLAADFHGHNAQQDFLAELAGRIRLLSA